MIYDYIIIGGGIAGVYCAYQLKKRFPDRTILLLEKSGTLGGRVDTFQDRYMTVEAGAGRFSDAHSILVGLIDELKLKTKIVRIKSAPVFAPSDGTGHFQNSVFDAPGPYKQPIVNAAFDMALGQTIPNAGMIIEIVLASRLESPDTLRNMTFIQFIKKVVGPKGAEYIKQSFGYYSELIIMNAYDAVELMIQLGPQNQFYSLKGGLTQIVERMTAKIKGTGSSRSDRSARSSHSSRSDRILLNREVLKVHETLGSNGQSVFSVECSIANSSIQPTRSITYVGKTCICAVPKQVLEKIPIFKPISSMLKHIQCGSLCRIYSKFDTSSGDVWFKNMQSFTTNNHLRIVIPYNEKEGIIMISYSDNMFADFWNKLESTGGIGAVNRELARLMKLSTGIDIPPPIKTHVFYWKCGVGYWGVGANSGEISKRIIHPFPDKSLFICGEHYSESGQQWMEGALETSDRVLGNIH
jgi:monoamine oxidase